MSFVYIESMLIFREKVSLVFFFLNYNFNLIFLFYKNNDYVIRLGILLTFFRTITNFLIPLTRV